MTDANGFKKAASLGVTLGNIGTKIVLENDKVRIWEVHLDPGQSIGWHFHFHPYSVVSLRGDRNVVETIFGERNEVREPVGATICIDKPATIHRLHNISDVPYTSRLIEMKHLTWVPDGNDLVKSSATPEMSPETSSALSEFSVQTTDLAWVEKSLAGLSQKMLWRNEQTGASIALVRFEKGAGVPEAHAHASNQFMFCLSGTYRYLPTGTTLVPGTFYCNPRGAIHGPTIAEETCVLLEIYDGPHYPVRPSWYSNDHDAR